MNKTVEVLTEEQVFQKRIRVMEINPAMTLPLVTHTSPLPKVRTRRLLTHWDNPIIINSTPGALSSIHASHSIGKIISGIIGAVIAVIGIITANPSLIFMGLSMLIGAFLPSQDAPSGPSFDLASQAEPESVVHTFGSLRNTIGQGILIPVVYGTQRMAGHQINAITRKREFRKWRRRVSADGKGAVVGADSVSRFVVEFDESITGFQVTFTAAFDDIAYGNWGLWYKARATSTWTWLGWADLQGGVKVNVFKWGLASGLYDVGASVHYHYRYDSLPAVTFTWNSVIGESSTTEQKKNTASITLSGSGIEPLPGFSQQHFKQTTYFVAGVGEVTSWTPKAATFTHNVEYNFPDDPEELVMLLAVCEGTIGGMSTFEADGNSIDLYDQFWIETRFGEDDQTTITGQDKSRLPDEVNVNLSPGNAVSRTTTGNIHEIELVFVFPGGLFAVNNDGNLTNRSIQIKIEYRVNGDPSYITHSQPSFVDNRRTALKKRVRLTRDTLTTTVSTKTIDVKVTRLTGLPGNPAKTVDEILWLENIEILAFDHTYPNIALANVVVMASDQISGQPPQVTNVVKGVICKVPHLQISAATVEYSDFYWDSVNSLYKRFSDDTAATDTGTYIEQWTSNPVWHAYNSFRTSRYGAGGHLTESLELDIDQFKTESQFCDELVNVISDGSVKERRFENDRAFDSQKEFWEHIGDIALTCQAVPVNEGSVYKFKIDRPVVRSNVIASSSTVKDSQASSLAGNFFGLGELFNAVNVQFNDRLRDFQLTPMLIEDQQAFVADETAFRVKQLRMVGVSRRSQIERRVKKDINTLRLIDQTIEVTTGWDQVGTEVFARIGVQAYFTKWNAAEQPHGLRVKSFTSPRTIVLDGPVEFSGANTYEIIIRHNADNTLETKELDPISGIVDEVTIIVSETFATTPAIDDVIIIGVQSSSVKDFRVLSIGREASGKCKLSLIAYNENVYVDTAPTESTATDSATVPPNVRAMPTDVEDFAVTSFGNFSSDVILSWSKPEDQNFGFVDIYRSLDSGLTWVKIGTSDRSTFTDPSRQPGKFVLYTAQAVSVGGVTRSPFATAPRAGVIVGAPAPPPRPTGLRLFKDYSSSTSVSPFNTVFAGTHARFEWNAIQTSGGAGTETNGAGGDNDTVGGSTVSLTFADYQVEIYSGSTLRRRMFTRNISFTYTYQMNFDDGEGTPIRSFTIKVRARNTDGNLSDPAELTVSNPVPQAPANVSTAGEARGVIVSYDSVTDLDFAGYKINMSASSGFTPDDTNLVYDGLDNKVLIAVPVGSTRYFKVGAYDSFGKIIINYSAEASGTPAGFNTSDLTGTISSLQLNTGRITITGETWTPGSPTADAVAWAGMSVVFNGVTYPITDSDTTDRWLYWTEGATTLASSSLQFPILSLTQHLVAYNDVGMLRLLWNNPLGQGIITSTLLATDFQLTASAQIASAVINDAHITSLNASKITAGTITADLFESTLFGDLGQAFSYVEAMLSASPEFSAILTEADIDNGTFVNMVRQLTEFAADEPRIRLITDDQWDDVGLTWDGGGVWDEPVTTSLGSWQSDAADGDMTTNQTGRAEFWAEKSIENPGTGVKTFTVKIQFQKDGSATWGVNSPDYDDAAFETMVEETVLIGAKTKWTSTIGGFRRKMRVKVEIQTSIGTDRIFIIGPELRFNDVRIKADQTGFDTQTTVGSAGAASALPATPTGYALMKIDDGTEIAVPYYDKL